MNILNILQNRRPQPNGSSGQIRRRKSLPTPTRLFFSREIAHCDAMGSHCIIASSYYFPPAASLSDGHHYFCLLSWPGSGDSTCQFKFTFCSPVNLLMMQEIGVILSSFCWPNLLSQGLIHLLSLLISSTDISISRCSSDRSSYCV